MHKRHDLSLHPPIHFAARYLYLYLYLSVYLLYLYISIYIYSLTAPCINVMICRSIRLSISPRRSQRSRQTTSVCTGSHAGRLRSGRSRSTRPSRASERRHATSPSSEKGIQQSKLSKPRNRDLLYDYG